ncbi:MAG TPA: hypothetical protein VKK31_29195 [Thermoanaerobaculia bacterium]|nr:hypothetical protein [Thermoanaerobaculia bacterium]
MAAIEILAFESSGGRLRSHLLPLEGPGSSCSLRLRSLPGASGVHLVLTNGGGVLLRAEVDSEGDEWVEVTLEWETESRWTLSSPGRRILYLPPESDYEPIPPLRPAYKSKQLDVALVVDGTTQANGLGAAQTSSPLLLADRETWGRQADLLIETITGLAREMKADLRAVVLAFGDRPVPATSAPDLRPVYHLYPARPEDRVLRGGDPGQLRSRLLSLPATSGGDFVDSLADALAACRELRWRAAARKLVVLVGDSPGYSILQPAPWGADAQVRECDVDVEAAALHRQGVELLALYHAPAVESATAGFLRPFVDHARAQYLRMATRPDLFFEAAGFEPAAAVATLMSRVPVVGRGASPGILAVPRRARRARG